MGKPKIRNELLGRSTYLAQADSPSGMVGLDSLSQRVSHTSCWSLRMSAVSIGTTGQHMQVKARVPTLWFGVRTFAYRLSSSCASTGSCGAQPCRTVETLRMLRTSASACLSGSRVKILMMLSLAPLTMSPVSSQAATAHKLIAGCVMVCILCPFRQIFTVRSSDELTISPFGNMARL